MASTNRNVSRAEALFGRVEQRRRGLIVRMGPDRIALCCESEHYVFVHEVVPDQADEDSHQFSTLRAMKCRLSASGTMSSELPNLV